MGVGKQLVEAIYINQNDKVTELLRRIGPEDVNETDGGYGQTPLHAACRKNNVYVTDKLLSVPGIQVNARDSDGMTAIMYAAVYNSSETLKILLFNPDVDVNARSNNSRTAIIRAAANNNSEALKLLLDHPSVDLDIKDNQGRGLEKVFNTSITNPTDIPDKSTCLEMIQEKRRRSVQQAQTEANALAETSERNKKKQKETKTKKQKDKKKQNETIKKQYVDKMEKVNTEIANQLEEAIDTYLSNPTDKPTCLEMIQEKRRLVQQAQTEDNALAETSERSNIRRQYVDKMEKVNTEIEAQEEKIMGDRINSQDRMLNDKMVSKSAYDRRMSKLPPRLAKQREVSRAAARGTGGTSPNVIEQNGWPEGEKMGVFEVEDLGTNAWDKPLEAASKDKEIVEGQNGANALAETSERSNISRQYVDKMEKVNTEIEAQEEKIRKNSELEAELERKYEEDRQHLANLRKVTDQLEAARETLECPVCLEMMSPPVRIWMCSVSHLICEPCKEKLQERFCPICRTERVSLRAHMAENFARTLYKN